MKIKLLSTALLLWLATGIASCKKDNPNTLIVKLSGKWQVLKIETKTFNASGAVVTDNTVNYGVSDYLDFKNNESSDLEVSLAGTRQVGNYVVFLGTAFNLSLPSKLLACNAEVINDNTLQFTGTIDGSSPRTTETWFLKR